MEINHQCRHLLKGEGKQGSLSKGSYQETIRKRRLTVSEGGIRANTDEYSIYGNRGENVKEYRFANHSKEYAKGDVYVNTVENRHA